MSSPSTCTYTWAAAVPMSLRPTCPPATSTSIRPIRPRPTTEYTLSVFVGALGTRASRPHFAKGTTDNNIPHPLRSPSTLPSFDRFRDTTCSRHRKFGTNLNGLDPELVEGFWAGGARHVSQKKLRDHLVSNSLKKSAGSGTSLTLSSLGLRCSELVEWWKQTQRRLPLSLAVPRSFDRLKDLPLSSLSLRCPEPAEGSKRNPRSSRPSHPTLGPLGH